MSGTVYADYDVRKLINVHMVVNLTLYLYIHSYRCHTLWRKYTALKNSPQIVKLIRSKQVHDQYFILVEQDVLVDTNTISRAILLWFAVHYVFNMEYANDSVGHFIQDMIFCLGGGSRKSSYKSISGNMKPLLKGI